MTKRILILLAVVGGLVLAFFWFSREQNERIDLREIPDRFPKIDQRPSATNWGRDKPKSAGRLMLQVQLKDLRFYDLSELDLRESLDDLFHADFNTQTIWPPDDRMPKGFDWKNIQELGKNPGLGVRSLHARGITGKGVGIAIIDQPLLVDHQEYSDQIQLYEEGNLEMRTESRFRRLIYRLLGRAFSVGPYRHESSMHGPAVASIAVGKTVGVAPEAMLYYIATWASDWKEFGESELEELEESEPGFVYYAQAVRRILKINSKAPENGKVRVIAMQIGWGSDQAGYEEITAACEEAKAAGMLVVSSSIEEVHGFKFHGLGRHPLAEPDDFESYKPASWWTKRFYAGDGFSDRLLVPMDSRTTASPGGVEDYVFYRKGGLSWSIPYIAGIYALAVQVDPGITPDRFWSLAMETGRIIQLEHEGEMIPFGPILDPVALIDAL
ncbi:S8 family serine peptidase [Candidatus Poribacteria bacterium]